MPVDPKKYPKDWAFFSRQIRLVRADSRCECVGECGLHGPEPTLFSKGGVRRCVERDGEAAKWAKGRVMLTVAHLNAKGGPCACSPLCANPDHVKALCNRCHLRYDVDRHVESRTAKKHEEKIRRLKK
jgi:hypothetical protein